MFNLTPTVRNLLLVNVAVFLLQQSSQVGQLVTQLGSLYPLGSPFFHVWQFFTYMFLHGSMGHIFGNMFGLISFGPMLELRWGARRFLTFWLVCGLGAGVLYEGIRVYDTYRVNQAYTEFKESPGGVEYRQFIDRSGLQETGDDELAYSLARNPRDQELRQTAISRVDEKYSVLQTEPIGGMLGASGALFGVLFAFAYLFPNTELMLLFFPVPIKAKYFVALYGLYELYAGVHRAPGDNVAHFAHLGGLLIGFILIKIWERGRTQFY